MRVDKIAVTLVVANEQFCRVTALDIDGFYFAAFEHLHETVVSALIHDLGRSCQLVCNDESDDDEKYHADDYECASCGWFHLSS